MIEKIPKFEPIPGDDLPVYSQVYEAVPDGYRFDDLVYQSSWTHLNKLKDRLTAVANAYYADYEIMGKTYADFFRLLQNALDMNADTFEKMMDVYDDDIAKPTQSRTITRTYNLRDTGKTTDNRTNTTTGSSSRTDKSFELPTDNTQTPYETTRDESSGSNSDKLTVTGTQSTEAGKTGTETEDWSDVGVAPNYVLLNGFLDNNRTKERVFMDFFKDCFTLIEGLY